VSSDVKTAKFDMAANIVETFPPALAQSLGAQGGGLSNITVDVSGKGQMQLPDKAAMNFQAKVGGVTVTVDSVVAGGKFYIKDPTTGNWTLAQGTSGLGQFKEDIDANLDLGAILAAAMPAGATPFPGIPANATIHLVGHISVNLHDFNSTVTVAVPSVSPS